MTRYRIVTKQSGVVTLYVVQQTVFGLTWTTLGEYFSLDFANKQMDALIAERATRKNFKSEVIRSE